MTAFFIFLGGCIVGIIMSLIWRKRSRPDGFLFVDYSEPGKVTYHFEINNVYNSGRKKDLKIHVQSDTNLSR